MLDSMGVAVLATLQIDPSNAGIFEAAFAEMKALVEANEPDCLLYTLTRSRGDAGTYRVFELYRSGSAFEAHTSQPYVTAAAAKLGGLLSAAPLIEVHDVLG